MKKAMCKITYYENILEFKEKCKEQLHVNEINNWQLCRTCMADTSDDDVIMEKMSVIDVMHGSFLSIEEMLFRTVDIKVTAEEHLPAKVCKNCVAKISALYYFTLQVHKADKVLKRLASKLNDYQNAVEIYKTQDKSTEDDIPEDIIIELDETFCNEDAKYIENVINTLTEEKQTLTEVVVDQTTEIEETSALFKEISEMEAAIIKDQENLTEFNIKLDDEECHLEEEFLEELEDCDVDNEDTFEDTAIITANNVKTTKRKKYKLRKNQKKDKPMPAYRHKQPRVSSPLLIDFTCAICQNSFLRQQDLINHVRESHPTSKAYKCRVCGIYFSHIQSLSRHMNSHKNDIVLNMCKFCSKTFARADDLKRHLRVHTGERPYVCTICQKSFQQQFAFKTHKEKHWYEEMNLNPKKFKCTECGQAYLSRNGLYLHKRRKHCTQKSRAPLYDCSLCDQSFHFEAELKRHADKHFLPEFMQCTECDKSFTSANGLYVHKKKNHKSDSNDSKESEKENENEQPVKEEEFLDNKLPVSYT